MHTRHVHHVVEARIDRLARGHKRICLCGGLLGDGDVFLLRHQRQHQVAALPDTIRILQRIVEGRALRHRGQRRRFREGHARGRLAEVVTRRRIDAVPPMTEVNRVQIRFEDLRLVVASLHVTRRALLAQLAPDRRVAPVDQIRMHVADKLLRDGARTARIAHYRVLHRRRDADQVDAVVLIEALVFDGNERLPDVARQRCDRDARAQLFAEFANDRTVTCQHHRRLWQWHNGCGIGSLRPKGGCREYCGEDCAEESLGHVVQCRGVGTGAPQVAAERATQLR